MSDYDTQTTSNIGYGYDEPFPIKNIPYYGYNEYTDIPSSTQPPSNQPQNYIPIQKSSIKPEYILIGSISALFLLAIIRR